MYLYAHKDLKGSLTRDFRGKLIHEKNLNLKISCQTAFKGLSIVTEASQHYFVFRRNFSLAARVPLLGILHYIFYTQCEKQR
jgi:hypothetical protein